VASVGETDLRQRHDVARAFGHHLAHEASGLVGERRRACRQKHHRRPK